MKNLRLLTWLDVKRIISHRTNYGTNLPDGVVRIDSFSDALEIGLDNDKSIDNAKSTLKEWFGNLYQEDQSIIQLDLGNETLSVEFSSGNELHRKDKDIRPFWEGIGYIDTNLGINLPTSYNETPNLKPFGRSKTNCRGSYTV